MSLRHVGVFLGFVVASQCFLGCDKKLEQQHVSVLADTSAVLTSYPREQSLYVGGFQWGEPASFNPLAVTPAWPVTGNVNLIYEALFGYNLLDGKIKGILAKSYTTNRNLLEVQLHEEAAWQSGQPLTAEDVVSSFELHKKYATSFSGCWNHFAKVATNGPHAVTFTMSATDYNPLVIKDILASVQILPKKVMDSLETAAFTAVAAQTGAAPGNADVLAKLREGDKEQMPVGSGPYALEAYSERHIVLKRVDSYWGTVLHEGKKPAPRYIIHSLYDGNEKFAQALEEGSLDISQTFCPNIREMVASGVGTWYEHEPFYIPGILPSLLMSVTKKPCDDVRFRCAVAYAIDYEKIRVQALSGCAPQLRPGLIVPFGIEKQFFSEEAAALYGAMYDPDRARKMLKDAGYTRGADGMIIILGPNGKPVTLYAICPRGWTDWEVTIKIAVEGMRAVGINVQEKFVDYAEWDGQLKSGMFDFAMKTPQPEQAASLPWSRFQQALSSKDLLPIGEVMYRNEGRYRNDAADKLLTDIPKITDPEKLVAAYRALNQIFINEMPVIPLMYRPWLFYQFSSRYWTNFPTEKNPYAPPQCLMVGAGVAALWGIVPAQ